MFIDDIIFTRQTTAYICDKSFLTYDDLQMYSLRLADYLHREGNSPILVYGHKSPMMIICFLACLMAGRAYIPCDESIPKTRIEEIIQMSGAKIALCNQKLEIKGIECLEKAKIVSICLSDKAYNFSSNSINMDSDAYIIFTSGSTGMPKGVRISYSNLENFIKWFSQIRIIKETNPKVILNQAVFSFDLSVADIFYSLTNGASLYAVSRAVQQDFSLLFSAFKDSNAEMAVITPSFAQMCLCDKSFNQELLPFLKIIFFCGEILKPITVRKLFERFPNLHIINAYGPTEATCCVTCIEITKEMSELEHLPIGEISSSAVNIDIIGENGEVLSDNQKGQIVLCGKSVSKGYSFVESDLFVHSGKGQCFYTGDIGYKKNDYLYFVSRKDEMIKYKGYRIELGDIENNLCKISGVNGAVVVAKFYDNGNAKFLTAYVCCEESFEKKSIKEKLKIYLPEYMIPKIVYFVDKIPLNSNGKLDKSKLARGETYA